MSQHEIYFWQTDVTLRVCPSSHLSQDQLLSVRDLLLFEKVGELGQEVTKELLEPLLKTCPQLLPSCFFLGFQIPISKKILEKRLR